MAQAINEPINPGGTARNRGGPRCFFPLLLSYQAVLGTSVSSLICNMEIITLIGNTCLLRAHFAQNVYLFFCLALTDLSCPAAPPPFSNLPSKRLFTEGGLRGGKHWFICPSPSGFSLASQPISLTPTLARILARINMPLDWQGG